MTDRSAQLTWNAIYFAAVEAGFYQEVMAADENASTTVYEEKSEPIDAFDRVALISLQGILADNDNLTKGAREFFTSLGVKF